MDRQQAQTAASQPAKDKSSEKLVGAKEALKQKLLRAVMKQAMEEIGSPDNIAEKAMSAIDTSKPPIPTAADRLQNLLLGEIANQAFSTIADSDATASQIAQSLSMDRDDIQAVILALRDRLTDSISDAAVATLADAELTATELSERVSIGRPDIQNVIQALRERIAAAIRQDVLRRFESTDEVADRIGETIPSDDPRFGQIQDVLLEQFLGTIKEQTLERLTDIDQHVDTVRSTMDAVPAPVEKIADGVKDLLTAEARQKTLENLEQIDVLVAEVMGSLGDDVEAVSIAADRIRSTLVDEIHNRAKELIADVDESAKSARDRIGSDPVEVVEASHRLKEILLQEIARRSTDAVREDSEAVGKALSLVDLEEQALVEIREGIKKRILTQVLSSAISEIHEEVAEAASEVGFDLNIEDVVFDFGSASASADASDEVSALDDLIQSDQGAEDGFDDMFDALGEKKSLVGSDESRSDSTRSESIESKPVAPSTSSEDALLGEPPHSEDESVPQIDGGSSEPDAADAGADNDSLDESAWQPLSEIKTSDSLAENGQIDYEGAHEQPSDSDSSALVDADFALEDQDNPHPAEPDLLNSAGQDNLDSTELDSTVDTDLSVEADEALEGVDELTEIENLLDGRADVAANDVEQPEWVSEVHFDGSDEEDHEEPTWDSDSDLPADLHEASAWEPDSVDEHHDLSEWAPTSEKVDRDDSVGKAEIETHEEPDDVYYIYGILATAGPALEGPIPLGLNGGRVEGLDFEGLSAMVSRVPADEFSGDTLKANLKDPSWLQENVRKHASIIAQIRDRQTLLPMAFCTIHPDRESVLKMLEAGYDNYFDALDHVKGKQEWGLRIYRNIDSLQEKVSESDRRVDGAFSSISKSVVSYLRGETNRMNEGDNAMQLMTEHCTQRSHESILAFASDGRKNPDGGGHPRDHEDIALNMAYLVPDGREADVRAEVDRLQAEYLDLGFRFELTGPWPPYHFVTSDKARDAVRSQQ